MTYDLMGDNGPPEDTHPIEDRIRESRADLWRQLAALEEEAAALPAEVVTEDQAAAVTDLAGKFQRLERAFEAARTDEKKEYLDACLVVDNLLGPRGPQATTKTRRTNLASRVTAYNRRKAEEERRRQEQLAEERRQEEARKREEERAAREAEDHANADQARLEAERLSTQARVAQTRADGPQRQATRGESSTSYTVKVPYWEVTDQDQVRLELGAFAPYLAKDAVEAALTRMAKLDNPPIVSGVTFGKRDETRIRS